MRWTEKRPTRLRSLTPPDEDAFPTPCREFFEQCLAYEKMLKAIGVLYEAAREKTAPLLHEAIYRVATASRYAASLSDIS